VTLQRLRRNPAIGWMIVAAGGLILALMATQGSSGGEASGRPAVRLMASVPAPLNVAIFGLFALTALFTFWLLIPRGFRRPKKDEESFDLVHEVPKASPWSLVVMLALSAVPLVLMGYVLWRGWSPFVAGTPILVPTPGVSPRPVLPAQGAFVPYATEPWFSGAVTVLALAAGAGCLALIFWILFGDRMIGSWGGLLARPRTSEGLLEAIDDSLEALRREPDARRAIVRCYRLFEHALTRRGLPRDPWETPTEFMWKSLGRLPLPSDIVKTLIHLFHAARFSDHPLGPSERDLAVDSLVEVRAALEGKEADASTI
jgi:Domain of unknown function (DUF4129)